tara:strand:- start:224 stop:691 length:468 start_codon:yes stop_codon:yes gene_type:complete
LSNFQEELRLEGYENIIIIAVGQSVANNFNSNFCANSNLPLVVDQYPNYEIREQFSPYGEHHYLVILSYDGSYISHIDLLNLGNAEKNYIRSVLEEHYQQSIVGDINNDEIINIQDVILIINMILNQNGDDSADLNADGNIDILDVVIMVNIILE